MIRDEEYNERIDMMLEFLQHETDVDIEKTPFYDREIYNSISVNNADLKPYLTNGIFRFSDKISCFYDLCRVLGITEYAEKLRDKWYLFAAKSIRDGAVSLSEIPYCSEEFEEMCELYLSMGDIYLDLHCGVSDADVEYLARGAREPLRTFAEIVSVEKYIMPRAQVHSCAKKIAALVWFMLYYHESYRKCETICKSFID